MKKVRITVMRKVEHTDLMEEYENPIEHACDMSVGQTFIANGWERPEGLCLSAWESMSPFVMTLSHGGGDFYDGWMKNKNSAMISCNDGFRPVSFLLETMDEEADKNIDS
ncbi:MAG: TIGR04076 family protein [Clostridia bacterium]|nr:TIGR04076 family protein [Clostridia bacterium]